MKKRLISLLLVLAMLLPMLPAGAAADYAAGSTLVASGNVWGNQETWELYDDGTMYILHNGDEDTNHAMTARTGSAWRQTAPWAEYAEEYGPFNVVIQQGFVNIGKGIFDCTYTGDAACVAAVTIPDSVQTVDEQAFFGQSAMEEVVWGGDRAGKRLYVGKLAFAHTALREMVFPDGTYFIGEQALGDTVTLEKVVIPGSVGNMTDTCRWLLMHSVVEDLFIGDGVTAINWIYALNEAAIRNIHIPASTTISTANLWPNQILNRDMNIISESGSPAEDFAKTYMTYFNGEFTGMDISYAELKAGVVLDADKYDINWYYKGYDEVVSTGKTLHIDDPTRDMEYEIVLLDDDLLYQYYLPGRKALNIAGRQTTYKDDLTSRPYVSLYGYISGTNLEYWGNSGSITATQYFGETSRTFTSDFRVDSSYYTVSLSSYLRDHPTHVEVRLADYLPLSFDLTMEDLTQSGSSYSWNLGVLNFASYEYKSGDILLDISISEPVREGETPAAGFTVTDFDALTITAVNITTGQSVAVTEKSYPYITLDTAAISVGNEIQVNVAAADGGSASGTVTLDGDCAGSLRLLLPKQGKIAVSAFVGVGDTTVMLFDASGSLVSSKNVRTRYTSDYLPDGRYTLVMIEKNSLLGSAASLTELQALGFTQGTDYVLQSVDVQRGVIADLGTVNIPDFDEFRYSYVDPARTGTTPAYAVISAGQALNIRAEYTVTEDHTAAAKTMRIDLPENVALAEGSLSVDGRAVLNKGTDTSILVDVGSASGIVRFQISAKEAGHYETTAYLTFTENGKNVIQPVGTAVFDVEALSINVPRKTGRENVTVGGRAIPGCDVEVFDNGASVGTASTNYLGDWSLSYKLTNPSSFTLHEAYAVLRSSDGRTDGIVTETETIEYYTGYTDVASVSIVDTDVVFDYNNPSRTNPYIVTSTDYRVFTYIIRFQHDADKVHDVYLNVFNQDRSVVQTEARYDAANDYWVASVRSFPINVGVEFECDVEFSEEDFGTRDDVEVFGEEMRQCAQELSQYFESGSVQVIDDNVLEIKFHFYSEEFSGGIYVSEIDYAQFASMDMDAKNFVQMEDGTYQKINLYEDSIVQTCVSPEDETAISITIPFAFAEVDSDGIMPMSLMSASPLAFTDLNWGRFALDVIEKAPIPGLGAAVAGFGELPYLTRLADDKLCYALDYLNKSRPYLDERCKYTGEFRLTDSDRARFRRELDDIFNEIKSYEAQIDQALDVYRQRIKNSLGFDALMCSMSAIFKGAEATLAGIKDMPGTVSRLYNNFVAAGNAWEFFADSWDIYGAFSDFLDDVQGVELPQEVGGFMDMTDVYGSPYLFWIIKTFDNLELRQIDLLTRIAKAYRPCVKEPEEPVEPVDPVKSPCKDTSPIIDPSGYVCEAVPSNRLEGVKATAYQVEDGVETLWNAEDYGQENPLYTNSEGRYEWFVPNGDWKVKFEKDGYETAWSEQVTVPPIQTEVNAAMVSTADPDVELVSAYTDGIRVEFTQYMRPETVNGGTVTVTVNGVPAAGTLESVNAEGSFANPSVEYASIYRFVPDVLFSVGDTVSLSIDGAVSYNGKSVSSYSSGGITAAVSPREIAAPEARTIAYGETGSVTVRVLPKGAAVGKTVNVTSSSSIVSLSGTALTVGADGTAKVSVTGALPGAATLTFTLEGTDITASTGIDVRFDAKTDPDTAPGGGQGNVSGGGSTGGGSIGPDDGPSMPPPADDGPEEHTDCSASAFTDLDPDEWYHEAVDYALDHGLMVGVGGTRFAPLATTTRGMVVTILYRLENEPAVGARTVFDDVGDTWYTDAVAWAAENGIVDGYGNGRFGPEDEIRREQFVAILYRYARYKGLDVSAGSALDAFNDHAEVSSYAVTAMRWAYAVGVITGITPTTLSPLGNTRRAETAMFLMRFCENILT